MSTRHTTYVKPLQKKFLHWKGFTDYLLISNTTRCKLSHNVAFVFCVSWRFNASMLQDNAMSLRPLAFSVKCNQYIYSIRTVYTQFIHSITSRYVQTFHSPMEVLLLTRDQLRAVISIYGQFFAELLFARIVVLHQNFFFSYMREKIEGIAFIKK